MSRLKWILLIVLRYYRSLGLRVSLYALLSLVAALVSPVVQGFLMSESADILDFGSVIPVLTILATSMLAVSTFSLNIMVSTHRMAATTTTPRVHRLLLEDTTTQSVLSTFIGAFVYSLTSIVLYQAKFYPPEAAIVVMGVTIGVVALVVVSMLRWIQHLTDLGSVGHSLKTVVTRAETALSDLAKEPAYGATPLTADTRLPDQTTPLEAPCSGYLQLVDVGGLAECLPEHGAVYVLHKPGAHLLESQTIAEVSGAVAPSDLEALQKNFVIGAERTFEQDAAFGLVVLAEIGSKALSPGINDAGTAIAVIGCLKSLLWDYGGKAPDGSAPVAPDVDTPCVFAPAVSCEDLCRSAFVSVARDGAATIEVAARLRAALAALSQSDNTEMAQAATEMADLAMTYCARADLLESEMRQLEAITLALAPDGALTPDRTGAA